MIMPLIKSVIKKCRAAANARYRANARAKAKAKASRIIPCQGVAPESLTPWPTSEYRREVALHILTLHGRDICQAERETCERYANFSQAANLDQARMDRLVNTYGHEL